MILVMRKLKYRFNSPVRKRYPKLRRHRTAKTNGWLIFILVFSVTVFLISFTQNNIAPIVNEKCISKAYGLVTVISNNAVIQSLSENNVTYEDLIQIDKNSDGGISSLRTDIVKTNKLKSDIVLKIQNEINNMETVSVNLPIGSVFGNSILSGYGFNIPIKTISIETISAELVDNFTSEGINQTKHSIMIDVNVTATVATSLNSTKTDIKTQIPIAETIIVGGTPDTYANLDSKDGGSLVLKK